MREGDREAKLVYGAAEGGTRPITLSIFADRAHVRSAMRDDAVACGLSVGIDGPLCELLEDGSRPLGDVVMVDCPQVDGAALAALSRLDLQAAESKVRLIVSTSVDALDAVFSCMDQSRPVLLVDPSRAERVIALGQALAGFSTARLRDLSEDDRLMLLRLVEQVGLLAGRMERLAPGSGVGEAHASAFAFADSGEWPRPRPGTSRGGRSRLPDPRLVRRMIRQRQQRARFFDASLFADPAWDMLLDLTAAQAEQKRVSVTSLCIAAGVPPTTALRWIGQMVEAGLFMRVCDDTDRRRAFIQMTDRTADAMARYFTDVAAVPVPV